MYKRLLYTSLIYRCLAQTDNNAEELKGSEGWLTADLIEAYVRVRLYTRGSACASSHLTEQAITDAAG